MDVQFVAVLSIIHSQAAGAQAFAFSDDTRVTIDGTATLLNAGGHISLAANRFYRILADQPVVVQTVSGLLDDYETELKLAP
jgi:hypothetical protein